MNLVDILATESQSKMVVINSDVIDKSSDKKVQHNDEEENPIMGE